MAAVIEKELGVQSNLVKSSGGVFEVTASDKLIFSKKASGRFPSEQEVLDSLKKIQN